MLLVNTFPNFNQYSLPLLIIVLQGYVFASLLIYRFYKKRQLPDLLLAILIVVVCFHRTTFTIGFLGWYDDFTNTKINYFLIDLLLAIGPLVYFYVKSLTEINFRFKPKDILHFLPAFIYFCYRVTLFLHDRLQPNFSDIQNGEWLESIDFNYVSSFYSVANRVSIIIYLVLSIQLYFSYRKQIKNYFSNTYKVQLNWLRNFLIFFILMFVIQLVIYQIHNTIVELHWTQQFWAHILSAVVIVYLAAHGYYADIAEIRLQNKAARGTTEVEEELSNEDESNDPIAEFEIEKEKLLLLMKSSRPYLQPELTIANFSREAKLPLHVVSQVLNQGFGKNFKDFINQYRIEAVKQAILSGQASQLTLIAIAFECGFNSKATFNRTFKKFTNQSPSEFLLNSNKQIENSLTA